MDFSLESIITIGTLVVGFISTIIPLIVSLVKAIKNKDAKEAVNIIQEGVLSGVKFAETLVGSTKEVKKTAALNVAENLCAKAGIDFNCKLAEQLLEKAIEFSQSVNSDERQKAKLDAKAQLENTKV